MRLTWDLRLTWDWPERERWRLRALDKFGPNGQMQIVTSWAPDGAKYCISSQDWLMWFAAFQNYQSNPWLLHLMGKMLENDPIVDSLIARNPFRGQKPPIRIRARHYKVIWNVWLILFNCENLFSTHSPRSQERRQQRANGGTGSW